MPSLMIRSTPAARLSTATVWVACMSTASSVANAGIMPMAPPMSFAVNMSYLLD